MRFLKGSFTFAGLSALGLALLGLSPGQPAPEFKALNQNGMEIALSQFKGKPVVLYFYPKDETPGCTKEACAFRDAYKHFTDLGAVVLGVSRQSAESHREFRSKHKLPFDLLVDGDGGIAAAFGVGSIPIVGWSKRKSFLIGSDGKIVKVYQDVDPKTHDQEVLEDLKSLSKQ